MAFIDLRQFHAGHTLVIPRQHLRDIRELDDTTAAALMASVARYPSAAPLPDKSVRDSYAETLRSYLN
ncbi:MAG: HIT domain-containing protein [Steroidobacteraceae bacterium]